MSDIRKDLEDTLLDLKRAYASNLPDSIVEIEDALANSLSKTAALAHKLSGTAGMYGFDILSRTASELEIICGELHKQAVKPSPGDKKKIYRLLGTLHESARSEYDRLER